MHCTVQHAHSRVNALYIIESENFILSNPRRKSIQHFNKDVAFSKTCGSRSSTPQFNSLCSLPITELLGIHSIDILAADNFRSRVQSIRDVGENSRSRHKSL